MASKKCLAVLAGLALASQTAYAEIRPPSARSCMMLLPLPREVPYLTLSPEALIAQEAQVVYKAGWLTAYVMSAEGTLKAAVSRTGIPPLSLDQLFSRLYSALLEDHRKK